MKDSTTHLSYKAEHTIDLDSDFLLDATIYHGNQADTNTLAESVSNASRNLEQAEVVGEIEEVVADKGYHSNQSLVDCQELGTRGTRTYIPELESGSFVPLAVVRRNVVDIERRPALATTHHLAAGVAGERSGISLLSLVPADLC